MDTNELLVRTMNAAKEARESGFYKTADAFDEIVESWFDLLDTQVQSKRDIHVVTVEELHNFQ